MFKVKTLIIHVNEMYSYTWFTQIDKNGFLTSTTLQELKVDENY
jgi:hypothetical protein